MKKICILGLGNMGKSIYDILRTKNLFEVSGCDQGDDINKALADCQAFVIAVKPQDFKSLAAEINVDLNDKVAVSIMAGVSMENIGKILNTDRIVRVMPNLPLKVEMSVSGWACTKSLSKYQKDLLVAILNCLGEEIEMPESKLDALTALSGSGPAYFYFLTELIKKASLSYGFSAEEARKIAETTFTGSAELLKFQQLDVEELRSMITSKGGTTEAAINSLEAQGFDKIFYQALEEARKRAEELNN